MNGENPYKRPPTKAAGGHVTHRRKSTNMARAERKGERVSATFNVATGPKIHVTGASGMPMPTTPVLDKRFTPVGWKRAVEYSGLRPAEMA
jgi:hypothetical protein